MTYIRGFMVYCAGVLHVIVWHVLRVTLILRLNQLWMSHSSNNPRPGDRKPIQGVVTMHDLSPLILKYHDLNLSLLDKKAAISQTILSDTFSWMKILYLIEISLKVVIEGPITMNQLWIYIMAWHRIGDKPLFELTLSRFTDAYMRH